VIQDAPRYHSGVRIPGREGFKQVQRSKLNSRRRRNLSSGASSYATAAAMRPAVRSTERTLIADQAAARLGRRPSALRRLATAS
ncbi:MAG: hypothetical protein QOH66_996, partial [Actinomycetota bacterium]|nr:hypothetical protein [Actinomycetota bacterium]